VFNMCLTTVIQSRATKHQNTLQILQTLSDCRKYARLNLFGKAVCGKVAILVDKLKPTKVTLLLMVPLLLPSLLVRTQFSFFPHTVREWNSHPICG